MEVSPYLSAIDLNAESGAVGSLSWSTKETAGSKSAKHAAEAIETHAEEPCRRIRVRVKPYGRSSDGKYHSSTRFTPLHLVYTIFRIIQSIHPRRCIWYTDRSSLSGVASSGTAFPFGPKSGHFG